MMKAFISIIALIHCCATSGMLTVNNNHGIINNNELSINTINFFRWRKAKFSFSNATFVALHYNRSIFDFCNSVAHHSSSSSLKDLLRYHGVSTTDVDSNSSNSSSKSTSTSSSSWVGWLDESVYTENCFRTQHQGELEEHSNSINGNVFEIDPIFGSYNFYNFITQTAIPSGKKKSLIHYIHYVEGEREIIQSLF
jgi:hypothetical protein